MRIETTQRPCELTHPTHLQIIIYQIEIKRHHSGMICSKFNFFIGKILRVKVLRAYAFCEST